MESQDLGLIWNNLLPKLEKNLSKPLYEALASSTKPLSLKEGKFSIAVQNECIKDWLSQYSTPIIEGELKALLPEVQEVELVVGSKNLFQTPLLETIVYSGLPACPARGQGEKPAPAAPLYLNPRYTFDSFVVGHCNRFAHAAALAVAEAPAKTYNPLFLYGGVGLGKTHLMQSIAHKVAQANSKAKILYITCEAFTNELITSLRAGKMPEFRNKYRGNDLLLVDDVQFLAGKEMTQEEFFHTFNSLYESGKQVVVSSDRPPKEIPDIEDRLRSRFGWGLTADIQPPDFETRIAILKKKAELSGLAVSDEILTFVASKIIFNIRELEGALTQIVAYASLHHQEISVPVVEQALKDMLRPEKEKIGLSIDLIKKATAEHYHLRLDELSAKVRTQEIALARQVAMYLARELAQASFPKIGEEFGGRDHTTVLYACGKIRSALGAEPEIEKAIRNITEKLRKYTPSL